MPLQGRNLLRKVRAPLSVLILSGVIALCGRIGSMTVCAAEPERVAVEARRVPVLRLDGNDGDWMEGEFVLSGPFTLETWVKLDSGVGSEDAVVGIPGVFDVNFSQRKVRVSRAGQGHDLLVSRAVIMAGVWTHLALTRDTTGRLFLYVNGHPDAESSEVMDQVLAGARVGWSSAAGGTAGWFSEFRVWNRSRTPIEVLEDHQKDFSRATLLDRPEGLVSIFPGESVRPPGRRLHGQARVESVVDAPLLATPAERLQQEAKLGRFRALAKRTGDAVRGRGVFAHGCRSCHAVAGEGGNVGPALDGVVRLGVEGLLRSLVLPSAEIDPAYRPLRVERKDGTVVEGRLVSQAASGLVLRRPGHSDLHIAADEVSRSFFLRSSLMPDGLLDGMRPDQISDLFAYLGSLTGPVTP